MPISKKFSNPSHTAVALVSKAGKDYRVMDDRSYFYVIDAEGYELRSSIFTKASRAVDYIFATDMSGEYWTGTPYCKD